MKTFITAVALATLIAVPAFTGSAAAAPKARRYSDQSWRSYPYYNGTYKGRPLSEWLRPGTW
jgi:hypothetical protein